MAEILDIKVKTSGTTKAISELKEIEKLVKTLNNKTVKISVDASGLKALDTEVKKITGKTYKLNIDTSSVAADVEKVRAVRETASRKAADAEIANENKAAQAIRKSQDALIAELTKANQAREAAAEKAAEAAIINENKAAQAIRKSQDSLIAEVTKAQQARETAERKATETIIANENKAAQAMIKSQEALLSEMQKVQAARESTAQKDVYSDATRAVKEYYAALQSLLKVETDVRLTEKGWVSESGNWDALAQQLNRVTTAFNALTEAENLNNLTDEQQLSIKRLIATESEKYGIAAENAANKAAAASKKNVLGKDEETRATKEATLAYEKYVIELEKAAALNPTKLQRQINYATGLDPDYSPKITAQNSMFGKLSDEQFRDYTTGAKTAVEITEELGKSQNKAAVAAKNQSFAQSKVNQDLSEASGLTKLLGNTLDVIIAKVVAWQVINGAVAAVVGSFREAVKTLKEVDSALVTVQKTTDFTDAQIKNLTNDTYALASAYGRTADELMNLNADFARAGFKDNLIQMTELAALLENVGDIEGETASKFLLAANAAWKLNGDYDALMQIIDGMNAVTNEAAVDMEALTTGITVAGSAFASAGEDAKTFTALVGTGVATTQRSGTEIARALRTVLMNVRQIKGELEDGEIIDEESISNAAKALNSIGVSVSQNGELRKFSDILSELAGKWDTLTSAEQSYIAESLANKRQANVLLSILQNYGEYERQLGIYATGAGSALKENEIYLDSWEAKTKKLSAAWTEFISHLIQTDAVKAILDGLIGVVKLLDSEFVQFGLTVFAVVEVVVALGKALNAIAKTKAFELVAEFIYRIAMGAASAQMAVEALWGAFISSPIAVFAAIAAGIYAVYKVVDALNVSYKEQLEIVNELNDKYEKQFGYGSEYEKLSKNVSELTDSEKARLYVLEGQKKALQDQIDAANKLAAQKWLNENSRNMVGREFDYDYGGFVGEEITQAEQNLNKLRDALSEADEEFDKGAISMETYISKLAKAVSGYKDWYDGLIAAKEAGEPLTEQEEEFIRLYESLAGTVGRYTTLTLENTEAKKENAEATDELSVAEKTLAKAMEEVDKKSSLTYATLADLEKLFPGLSAKILDANGCLTEEAQEALKTKDAFVDLISQQIIFNNTTLDVNGKIAALQALAAQAGLTTAALANVGSEESIKREIAEWRKSGLSEAEATQRALANYSARLTPTIKAQEYIPAASGGSSRSSGGSSAKTTDEKLEAYKKEVAEAEAIYNLMEKQGKSAAELEVQAKKVQDALHEQRVRMEQLNESTADQLALSAKWWDWQNKITNNYEKEQKAAGDAAKEQLTSAQNAVTVQTKMLQVVKALGEGSDAELMAARGITAAYEALFNQQVALNASQADLLTTALSYISAKKEELELEKSLTEQENERAEKEKELAEKYRSDTVKLRKTDVDLAKKLGYSTEEVLNYMRKYADAIAEQGKWMEQNQASQADINALALTYLDVLQDIHDLETGDIATEGQSKHLDFLNYVVSLRESELSLMEGMELSEDEQIRKYREILSAIEEQGNYQKEINAAQEDQNKTATEYYSILKKILSVQQSQLETIRDEALAYIEEQEEAAINPLQEQLDILKKQKEEAKAQREEDEKLLAVEKARRALENARNQRNVRIYNSAAGQWQWVANQKEVQSAEEALLKAQEQLAEYQYQLQIDALQSEIDGISKTFDTLKDAIKEAVKGIADGKYTFEQAYDYIAGQMRKIYDDYGVDLTAVMDTATRNFKGIASEIQITYEQIKTTALSFGAIDSVITEKSGDIAKSLANLSLAFGTIGADLDLSDYQIKQAEKQLETSVSLLSTLPDAIKNLLSGLSANGAQALPTAQQYTGGGGTNDTGVHVHKAVKPNGTTYSITYKNGQPISSTRTIEAGDYIFSEKGDASWSVSPERAAEMNAMIAATQSGSPTLETPMQVRADDQVSVSQNYATQGQTETTNPGSWIGGSSGGNEEPEWMRMLGFDSGGVLKGLGGIKATREDELIVPPDITKAILKPGLTENVADRLNELGVLTGARGISTFNLRSGNSIGSQHNGNIYNLGGVSLSQDQADAMTVSQFVGYVEGMTRELSLA